MALTLIRLEKLSDLSPNVFMWRLSVQTEFLVSQPLPVRAILWRFHQFRGFWKLVYWALQSPRRLASRQWLLSRLQACPSAHKFSL